MLRTLSFSMTAIIKIGCPLTVGALQGVITWLAFTNPDLLWLLFVRDERPPDGIGLLMLALFPLMLDASLRGVAPLKRVRIDDHSLYISNYLREAVVPISDLVDARLPKITMFTRQGDLSLIELEFRHPTPFGKCIRFIPASGAVLSELQSLVKRGDHPDPEPPLCRMSE